MLREQKRRTELRFVFLSNFISRLFLFVLVLVCAVQRARSRKRQRQRGMMQVSGDSIRLIDPASQVRCSTLEALDGFVYLCPAAECPAHSTRLASLRIGSLASAFSHFTC